MSTDILDFQLPSLDELQIAIDKARCTNSFEEFVKASWHVLEPSTDLKWGWAMSAICQHLQAVDEGKIKRLVINVPPGFSKSLLTSVFFPAWQWIRRPQLRIIGTSHAKDLAVRDSTKMRTLIESEFFQERWPLVLKDDQNAKSNFANHSEGVRAAAAFTKMTGVRGDVVILDDPISAFDANSAAELKNAEIAFLETLPSRINNEDSAIIVIMQRLSEKDVTGIILDKQLDYTMLMLPMRFESDRCCETSIGFKDPRTYNGELLFPEFFSEERVSTLEKSLGSYAIAGQLQQRPAPRDGGLFKRDWFQIWNKPMPNDILWVRGYDLAGSTKTTADKTSSVKMGITADKQIIIADCQDDRLSPADIKTRMKNNAELDGTHVRISIPKDPAAAGLATVEVYRQVLMGFDCRFSPESGDKLLRATPLAAQAEAGGVFLVKGNWNETFLDEVSNFPNAKHDDIVDAASRSFNELMTMTRPKKTIGVSSYSGRLIR